MKTNFTKMDNHRKRYEEGPLKNGVSHSRPELEKFNNLVCNLSKNFPDEIFRLELGPGGGRLSPLIRNWIGLSISLRELRQIKEKTGKSFVICANAERMPIRNQTVGMIFEHAMLEHVYSPEDVLKECIRVIQPGGLIIHDTAWNVRPWASNPITYKKYEECNIREKLYKMTIPIRNLLIVRFVKIFPIRLIREFKQLFKHSPSLDYRELTPIFDLRLGSDENACSSIDAHALIVFYQSSGFKTYGFLRRMFFRTGPCVIKAPDDKIK